MPWLSTPQPYFLQNFCASSLIHCLIFSLLLAIAAAAALAAADEDADKVLVIKGTLVDEVEEREALVGGGGHSGVLCDEEWPQTDATRPGKMFWGQLHSICSLLLEMWKFRMSKM